MPTLVNEYRYHYIMWGLADKDLRATIASLKAEKFIPALDYFKTHYDRSYYSAVSFTLHSFSDLQVWLHGGATWDW